MTLDRPGSGTATYQAPNAGQGNRSSSVPDVFGLASPTTVGAFQQQRLGASKFEYLPGSQKNGTKRWRYTIYDLRGGLNKTRGPIEDATPYFGNPRGAHNSLADSSMDGRFAEHMFLPLMTTSQSSPDPGGAGFTLNGIWSVNWNGVLYIGLGAGDGSATFSLFKETSATDPTIQTTPYSNSSKGGISSMASLIMGGATAGPRLFVSYDGFGGGAGGKGELYSVMTNGTATKVGVLHADLGSVHGVIQTFVDDNTILFYSSISGGFIYAKTQSSGVTAAGTTVFSGIPAGGYAVGMLSFAGGPIRAYWVIPYSDTTGTQSMLASGGERYGRLMSTNLRGIDLQEVAIVNAMLPNLSVVFPYRSGVVCSDGSRWIYHNGRETRDLHWNEDRKANSDRQLQARSGWTKNGTDLYVQVTEKASSSGSGVTLSWVEYYDFDLDSWQRVAGTLTLSTTGTMGVLGAPLPASEQNDFLHNYIDGSWRRIYQPPPGINPFSLRQTPGAGSSTGAQFEASGSFETPLLIFPDDIAYQPKVIDRIVCLGDLDAGGADAYCTVAVGGVERTVTVPSSGGTPAKERIINLSNNQNRFLTTNVVVTAARNASNTHVVPQVLPIVIEGTAFMDERFPAPRKFLWF